MLSRRKAWIFGIGIVFCLLVATYFLAPFLLEVVYFPKWQSEKTDVFLPGEEWVKVARVIDGDTIELVNGEKLRYIGINTPESIDPRRRVECFGKEASAFNKNLVEGKRVRLEKDISDRDKYDRLLRFVFLEDGTLANEALVREGYAYAMPFAPDISKKDFFRKAEDDARENDRGLWGRETCDGKK